MNKYEIMLITDPNFDEKDFSNFINSIFKNSKLKIEKMERTELAYEINKSKTASYYLVTGEASGDDVNELTRKVNITKQVWRVMSVNLDTEKGLDRKANPKRIRRPMNMRRNYENNRPSNSGEKKEINKSSVKTTDK